MSLWGSCTSHQAEPAAVVTSGEHVLTAAAECMGCSNCVLHCCAADVPCCLVAACLAALAVSAGGLHQQSWGDCGWSHRLTTHTFCCCIHTGVWAAVSGWHCTMQCSTQTWRRSSHSCQQLLTQESELFRWCMVWQHNIQAVSLLLVPLRVGPVG